VDLRQPFLGREAVLAGAVTRARLAGPGFRRLGPDVHVAAEVIDDLELRTRAAAIGVPGAVVGGYAAALLLDAGCGPRDADVELVVGARRVRGRPGVAIRQDVLAHDEVVEADGVLVTRPVRTALDLASRLPFVEAVVAVDALAHTWDFDPSALLSYPGRRANPRGSLRLPEVVAAADARAESPPETRTRLVLAHAGLARPELQHEVHDDRGRFVARLDLAWPALRIAVEYQGDHHRTDPVQWRRDNQRSADLAALGWLVLPATSYDLGRGRSLFVARVARALAERRVS